MHINIDIELPEEDVEKGILGRLNESVYGTRDAAKAWEGHYSNRLKEEEYEKTKSAPNMFYNKKTSVRIAVHGDDFFCAAERLQLDWLIKQMKVAFELKSQILGPDRDEDSPVKILNRIITIDTTWYIMIIYGALQLLLLIQILHLQTLKK